MGIDEEFSFRDYRWQHGSLPDVGCVDWHDDIHDIEHATQHRQPRWHERMPVAHTYNSIIVPLGSTFRSPFLRGCEVDLKPFVQILEDDQSLEYFEDIYSPQKSVKQLVSKRVLKKSGRVSCQLG